MDGNTNKVGQTNIIYCSNCGCQNERSNNFCISCGRPLKHSLINNDYPQNTYQNNGQGNYQNNNDTGRKNTKKVDKKSRTISFVVGFVLMILCYFVPGVFPLTLVLAFVSLFFENTRYYALGFLSAIFVLFVIGVILAIILFGMCFASIGGA